MEVINIDTTINNKKNIFSTLFLLLKKVIFFVTFFYFSFSLIIKICSLFYFGGNKKDIYTSFKNDLNEKIETFEFNQKNNKSVDEIINEISNFTTNFFRELKDEEWIKEKVTNIDFKTFTISIEERIEEIVIKNRDLQVINWFDLKYNPQNKKWEKKGLYSSIFENPILYTIVIPINKISEITLNSMRIYNNRWYPVYSLIVILIIKKIIIDNILKIKSNVKTINEFSQIFSLYLEISLYNENLIVPNEIFNKISKFKIFLFDILYSLIFKILLLLTESFLKNKRESNNFTENLIINLIFESISDLTLVIAFFHTNLIPNSKKIIIVHFFISTLMSEKVLKLINNSLLIGKNLNIHKIEKIWKKQYSA
ncbi:MAG TPA: hypothetical protein VN854_01130 [Mycoplasmatales bacterium]|jgi:hypothetical protein|nr:hypothetical protein [Mycoplasmatales bacterium]